MKCRKGFKSRGGKCIPGIKKMLFGKKRKLLSVFNISLALVILTHIYAIFFEMSEAMWLGHNLLMVLAGFLAWRFR